MTNSDVILSQLNPPQQEAVVFGEGPLLILAGPGSGKTRVLTHRAAWLIKKRGVNAKNILLLTFTNKAAEEMKTRLARLLDTKDYQLPWAGTFHSFCARVLRANHQFLNLSRHYLIYDRQDQLKTIKLAMEKIDVSPQSFKPTSLLYSISQAKNELLSALEYPQYARGQFQITAARVYLTYQRLLNRT